MYIFIYIGEQFGDPLLIGVVLSLRAKERLIEIWLKDGRNEAVRTAISKKIREILRIDFTNVMIYYKDHKRSIKVYIYIYIYIGQLNYEERRGI